MDNVSILDQIISDHKVEEVNNMDAVEIINNLLSELSEREQDVIKRRHGLVSSKKETLESIGQAHSLTRERIRQIETSSIKKLQELKNLDDYLKALRKVIAQLLEEHGGFMECEYLKDVLVGYSLESAKVDIKDEDIHKNYINFLITKLLHKEFEEKTNSKKFRGIYKFKHQDIGHYEEIAEDLLLQIRDGKKVKETNSMISKVKELQNFIKHQNKINAENNIDVVRMIKSELYKEDPENINNNKIIYSILRATEKIKQNKFGHWGCHTWREVSPKTINDKINIILKNKKKPMHFEEIAGHINEVKFDKKIANPATVHNELILDKKYVLVGRGLYGLKDWGFKEGSVVDVIYEVLRDSDKPLNRDEIIKRVLDKRVVKKATVILALMNKDKFDRSGDRYSARELV